MRRSQRARSIARRITAGIGMTMLLGGTAVSAGTTVPPDGTDGASSDLALDEPLRIGLLMAIPGESDQSAVANGFDAAQLAIADINAAGGLGGQDVEFFRVSYNIADPAQNRQAFLDALDEDPDILYGAFGGPGIDAIVTGGLLDEAAIPFITYGTPENRQDSESGSEWLFQFRSSTSDQAAVATRHAIETLGKSSIGVMYVDAAYGQLGLAGINSVLDEAGLEPVAEQAHDATATDLTSSVLAMQEGGADIVINWDFPSPLGVQLNQFLQNGLDVPTGTGASFATVVNGELASSEAIAANPETYGVNGCVALATSEDPAVTNFVERYVDEYGYSPDETSTTSYDAIHVIAAAVTAAGSVEPDAVREALASETLSGSGVCQPEYFADETGTLSHTAMIVGVNEEGALEAREVVDIG